MEIKPKRKKYRLRRIDGEYARLTISLSKKEKTAFEAEAEKRGITTSRVVADAATKTLGECKLAYNVFIGADDLEFMALIVKTVGVPLTLEELLSLLQKHKSKEGYV